MLQLIDLSPNVDLILIIKRIAVETVIVINALKVVVDVSNGLDIFSEAFDFSRVGKESHIFIVQKRQGELVTLSAEVNRMRYFLKLIGVCKMIVLILRASHLILY